MKKFRMVPMVEGGEYRYFDTEEQASSFLESFHGPAARTEKFENGKWEVLARKEPNRVIVAVQLYDNVVIVEWTMDEWRTELELLKKKNADLTAEDIERIGIRSTDNFTGEDLLDV